MYVVGGLMLLCETGVYSLHVALHWYQHLRCSAPDLWIYVSTY